MQVISDADADVLSQLVQQLGGILIEQMKANAVRTIVPVYHPQIVALCTLMANDFNPAKGELTTAYVGLAAGIRNDQVTILDRDGAQLATRSRALPSFAAANKEYHWARETLPEIGKGGEKCVAASAALLDAVNNRQYSLADLKAFAQQVQKIVSTASKWK